MSVKHCKETVIHRKEVVIKKKKIIKTFQQMSLHCHILQKI